jgi:hypothetical protein
VLHLLGSSRKEQLFFVPQVLALYAEISLRDLWLVAPHFNLFALCRVRQTCDQPLQGTFRFNFLYNRDVVGMLEVLVDKIRGLGRPHGFKQLLVVFFACDPV